MQITKISTNGYSIGGFSETPLMITGLYLDITQARKLNELYGKNWRTSAAQ